MKKTRGWLACRPANGLGKLAQLVFDNRFLGKDPRLNGGRVLENMPAVVCRRVELSGYIRRAVPASLALAILFSPALRAQGAVINARSALREDVGAAVNSARNGDTVIVPAGTATWTAPLNITTNITLQGAGAGSTVIIDEIPRARRKQPGGIEQTSRNVSAHLANRAGKPKEKIQAGQEGRNRTQPGSRVGLIFIDLARDEPFRMTGFKFQGGTMNLEKISHGEIAAKGNCHSFRIDHCTFDQLHGINLTIYGFLWGVVDHCIFNTTATHSIHVGHDTWNGGTYGNGSWADEPYWGSNKFLFIEDNVFENILPNSRSTSTSSAIDSFEGARFVVRYNRIHNVVFQMHGTEGQGRGAKQAEVYNNTWVNDSRSPAGQVRSGCIITHDNTWTNVAKGNVLENYRFFNHSPHWGPANGQNSYDDNIKNPATSGYWATGTHTGPATGGFEPGTTKLRPCVLEDSNPNKIWWDPITGAAKTGAWVANIWAPNTPATAATYIIRNLTQEATAAQEKDRVSSFAISNNSTTITASGLFFEKRIPIAFNHGDTYQIWKVRRALDQPGQGKSDLLTGLGQNFPASKALPYTWPHQVAEPCYSWNNTQAGEPVNLSSPQPSIQEGRDFFNDTRKPGYAPYTYPHPLTKR